MICESFLLSFTFKTKLEKDLLFSQFGFKTKKQKPHLYSIQIWKGNLTSNGTQISTIYNVSNLVNKLNTTGQLQQIVMK